MDSSYWHHFTPYRTDPEQALQELHQHVFESRAYLRAMRAGAARAPNAPLAFRLILLLLVMVARLRFWRRKRQMARAKTIDELREIAQDTTTQTILDISHVSGIRDGGVAREATSEWLQEIYGTTQPTRAQIEPHKGKLNARLDAWQAAYVVVYRDGKPDEYYFEGNSGE